ncbi:MAG: hypothetical protein M0Z28_09915 [Rhodospirillales bacterium]|nr:hypothetical protein [Rhodospirillales bacterium]
MADRKAEDSTAPKAREAPHRHNAELIRRILITHYGKDVRLPPADHFTIVALVAAQAAQWAQKWTPKRLDHARKAYFKELRRRDQVRKEFFKDFPMREQAIEWIRKNASQEWRITHVELVHALTITETPKLVATWPPPKETIEWMLKDKIRQQCAVNREWLEAIDQNGPCLFTRRTHFAKQGPIPERWTRLLGIFAPWLASILMSRGVPVSTRSTSPFTKTCCGILGGLLPKEKPRKPSTVSEALAKIIVFKRIKQNATDGATT